MNPWLPCFDCIIFSCWWGGPHGNMIKVTDSCYLFFFHRSAYSLTWLAESQPLQIIWNGWHVLTKVGSAYFVHPFKSFFFFTELAVCHFEIHKNISHCNDCLAIDVCIPWRWGWACVQWCWSLSSSLILYSCVYFWHYCLPTRTAKLNQDNIVYTNQPQN